MTWVNGITYHVPGWVTQYCKVVSLKFLNSIQSQSNPNTIFKSNLTNCNFYLEKKMLKNSWELLFNRLERRGRKFALSHIETYHQVCNNQSNSKGLWLDKDINEQKEL